MPYKIVGNAVVKANTGKVVGHSKNPKKYLQVLQMVEHGVKLTGKKKRVRKPKRYTFWKRHKDYSKGR